MKTETDILDQISHLELQQRKYHDLMQDVDSYSEHYAEWLRITAKIEALKWVLASW